MPRILITGFCTMPGPNRAAVQMSYIAQALSQQHSVDVLVLRSGDQAYVERNGDGRILRVPLAEGDLRQQIEAFRRALKRQLESSDYDVVHFRDGWSGVVVLEMRTHLGYVTVFDAARSPLGETPLVDLDLAGELEASEAACLAGADMVLVPTETARAHVAHAHPERIHVVPPGVNVDLFDWDDAEAGPPIVLYAGTVEPGRGVRVLLRAMVYVLAQVDARLLVAGAVEPEFARSLRGAIKDLGLSGRVELVGEVAHGAMPALIARSTVCVAPAASEPRIQAMGLYPTKVLEYMACRRAVVAPQRGSTAMLFRAGTHGLVFNPADPMDLSQSIVTLLVDHDLRARMAEAGYQLVRQHYPASATRRALRKAYAVLFESMVESTAPRARLDDFARRTPDESVEYALGEHLPQDSLQLALTEAASLADHTDEYESPVFEARMPDTAESADSVADTGETVAFPAVADTGETTAITRQPAAESWRTEPMEVPAGGEDEWGDGGWLELGSSMAAIAAEPGVDEEWVVPDWDESGWRSLLDAEDESTPVNVEAPDFVAGDESRSKVRGNVDRAVAGELVVPDRRTEAELDGKASFTAVSVLLGPLNEGDPGDG